MKAPGASEVRLSGAGPDTSASDVLSAGRWLAKDDESADLETVVAFNR
jgi:hypothetical protein